MKPNFALNITDTAISLLHRTSKGWLEVGQAAFDSPDLEAELGYLRSSALGLSPQGFTCKLVLPASQVRYMEIDAPGPDKAAREAQIKAALEGRTPYDVSELVFDWWGTGPKVQVAVVARETLEEAEGFAQAHRLNPVSFVTTPAEGQFAGEPWFGTSSLAASLLPDGEKVTRDQDPIKVVTRDMPKAPAPKTEPVAEAAEPEQPKAEDTSAKAKAAAEAAEKEAAEKAAAEKAEADKAAAERARAEREAEAKRAEQDAARAAEEAKAAAAAQEAEAAKRAEADAAKRKADEAEAKRLADEAESTRKMEAAKAEMELRAQQLAQAEAKRLVEEAEKNKAAMEARAANERAKAALIDAEQKRAASDAAAAETARAAFEGVTDPGISDPGKANSPAPTFASRRRDDASGAPSLGPAKAPEAAAKPAGMAASVAPSVSVNKTASVGPTPSMTPPEKPKPAPPTVTSISANKAAVAAPAATAAKPAATAPTVAAAPKPLNGTAAFAAGAKAELGKPAKAAMVTADRIPGKAAALSRFKSKVKEATLPPTAKGSSANAQTMGKFGAKLQPTRGKPRFLGLILTLILLAALAAIAAWSSIYLSRDAGADDPVQVAAAPQAPADTAVTAETEAEAQADAEAELPAGADAEDSAQAVATSEPEVIPEAEVATEPPAETAAETSPVTTAGPGPVVAADDAAAQAAGPGRGPQDEIFLAAIDDQPPAFDAVALPKPQARPDGAPAAAMPPPPFGTQYEFEPDGSIKATANGVVMPDGFWLIAARPPVVPPARPAAISTPEPAAPAAEATATPPPGNAATDAAAASTSGIATMTGPSDSATVAAEVNEGGTGPSSAFVQDATVENRRPRSRPEGLAPAATDPAATDPAQAEDDAALPEDASQTRLTSLRPKLRPQSVVAAAEEARKAAEAASLAARAAAEEKTASASEATLALSPRPAARPRDFSKAVAAAVSAATRETTRSAAAKAKEPEPAPTAEPEEQEEPEVKVSAAPRIPTRANVAKQATFKNAINLSKTNLIGVYGTDSKRYALIRTSSGRYQKVRVGDRVDGGTVAAITRNEVRYKKGSKMLALSMPKG
ncbi:hypothetical protein EGN72_08800 [Pseudorhodobacter sp. E13]|uniref:hypothetical protein n=1 Tax=Pseudorhodobacter sp. E13 TaxID=2487931 RepID=UPI000F8DB40A|nr:hypothetical protein [Pseudorhodobacter sp. E13]RUS60654.1 hypothetical protein EGN72_08800 [Pseudorhodobacter sp. E13]